MSFKFVIITLLYTICTIYTCLGPSRSFADEIRDRSDYQSYRNTTHVETQIDELEIGSCSGSIVDQIAIVEPGCLLKPAEIVALPLVASGVWSYIDDFIGGYQFDQGEFMYTGAQIVWKKIPLQYYQTLDLPQNLRFNLNFKSQTLLIPSFPKQNPWTIASMVQIDEYDTDYLIALQKAGVRLRIPLLARYRIQMESYYFAVVERNLRDYGRCSKHNYIMARSALHDLYLLPGQSFTINPLLAGLDGYCEGATPGKYLFYAGVCGVSTQLFRTSLLMPGLVATVRHGHNEWYTKYYGQKVVGDDAAILDYRKQFTIQNQHSNPLLIKGRSKGDSHYLIGITKNIYPTIVISKKELSSLQGQVQKTVFVSGQIMQTGERTTTYMRKNNEQN